MTVDLARMTSLPIKLVNFLELYWIKLYTFNLSNMSQLYHNQSNINLLIKKIIIEMS